MNDWLWGIIGGEIEGGGEEVEGGVGVVEEGNRVGFMGGYGKEMRGGVDEREVGNVERGVRYVGEVEERGEGMVKWIWEEGKVRDDVGKGMKGRVRKREVEEV